MQVDLTPRPSAFERVNAAVDALDPLDAAPFRYGNCRFYASEPVVENHFRMLVDSPMILSTYVTCRMWRSALERWPTVTLAATGVAYLGGQAFAAW